MIVAVLLFLVGLVLGFFASRELASREGFRLRRSLPRWQRPPVHENPVLEEEDEELLTPGELVARFGIHAPGRSSERPRSDPAVPD